MSPSARSALEFSSSRNEGLAVPMFDGLGVSICHLLTSGWTFALPANSNTCGGSLPKAPERNPVPAGSKIGLRPSARIARSTEAAVAGFGT